MYNKTFRTEDDRALLLAFIAWFDTHLTAEQATDWNEQPSQTVDEFLRQRQVKRESQSA